MSSRSTRETTPLLSNKSSQRPISSSSSSSLTLAPPPDRLKSWRLAATLASLWATNFCFAYGTTSTSTLSPQISSLMGHIELSSYIGSIFGLFSTTFTPLFGVLADTSRLRAMGLACTLYGLGQLGCALSSSFWMLLLSRALAGSGGGGILTISSVITTDLVALRDRGFYQGMMMVTFGLGSALGGPTSGWMSDRFGWQLPFLIQIPLLIGAMIFLSILLPPPPPSATRSPASVPPFVPSSQDAAKTTPTQLYPPQHTFLSSIDLPGLLILLLAVGGLLLGLSLHTSGFRWGDWKVAGLLGASAVGSCGFWVMEGRREKKGLKVLVPRGILFKRNVFWTCLSAFLMSLASSSLFYNIPLYFIVVRSTSAYTAGLHLLPNSVGLAVGSLLSGWIIRHTGMYRALGIASLVLPCITAGQLSTWDGETSELRTWLDLSWGGLGYSSFLVTSLIAMIAAVPRDEIGKATSISYLSRNLANTLGMAISGTIQQAVLSKELKARIVGEGSDKIIAAILHSKAYLSTLPPDLKDAAILSYDISLKVTFRVTFALGVLALLASIPIEELHLGEKGGPVGGGVHKPEEDVDERPPGDEEVQRSAV